jgi:hypothetical protein
MTARLLVALALLTASATVACSFVLDVEGPPTPAPAAPVPEDDAAPPAEAGATPEPAAADAGAD